jgi:hypothetical protein
MPFEPQAVLTMQFSVTEWNSILAQLQEGPWKIVAPLINKINLQAAQHEAAQASAAAVAPAPAQPAGYSNGALQPGDTVTATGDITGAIVLPKPE